MSMLRQLRIQGRPYARRCHTRMLGALPEKNIHNSSEIEILTNPGVLLENMHQRNNKLTALLQKQIERNQELLKDIKRQNVIAINHTFNDEDLDITKLKTLESDIRKKVKNDFFPLFDFYQLFSENKYRGHANE